MALPSPRRSRRRRAAIGLTDHIWSRENSCCLAVDADEGSVADETGATIERIWNEDSVEGYSSHGSHGGRAQHACRLLVQGLVY